MDFTREPIIETIITPKEGHKLVIRSTKGAGQEEYLVDAVEIVAFGHALFFRSLERPKAFLAPVSDYEVLEVREARMVLKNAGLDRSIKIGGGKDSTIKASKEEEKVEQINEDKSFEENQPIETNDVRPEVRVDKKRDRRRHYRKRRGKEEIKEGENEGLATQEEEKIAISPESDLSENPAIPSPIFSSLLQPPPTLISETIGRYRQNELFKGAFYLSEEEQYKPHEKVQDLLNEEEDEAIPTLQEPDFAMEAQPSEISLDANLEANAGASHLDGSVDHFKNVDEETKEEYTLPLYADEEDKSMSERNDEDPFKHLTE